MILKVIVLVRTAETWWEKVGLLAGKSSRGIDLCFDDWMLRANRKSDFAPSRRPGNGMEVCGFHSRQVVAAAATISGCNAWQSEKVVTLQPHGAGMGRGLGSANMTYELSSADHQIVQEEMHQLRF